ncbi:type I-E CRISPR-associated protein Cse1/CasA [Streptomyces sp. NPDC005900]|uniref:type I-E CRISPR-associated protein Cse1/CasA n=1 Tax=Streptomyces sp. NPDC005900 TaxID=3154569 RepID=UPI0033E3123C
MTDFDEPGVLAQALTFDLSSRPWIAVLDVHGVQQELSLREVFARAGRLRSVVGDLPTQEFALMRLLLAVAHDALEGPRDTEHWARLWADEDCFAPVAAYLDAHRERFDLLHPYTPFYQVAQLRTVRDEVFSLNRIVADVPNGEPFFSSRMPAVERLGFAEAARWVVHAHAYDTSGIKTGIDGDARAKGGKVYPLGVGWAGALGGVFTEGQTLRETLLLNLVAADTSGVRSSAEDVPAWRREPCEAGPSGRTRPAGVRDLYTWQSRRLRLCFDAEGAYGVVLGYGDPLAAHNMHGDEPMTAWRRSPAQEKKRGESLVYLPRQHDPERAAWRGLEALVVGRAEAAQGGEAAGVLRPGILEWIARLVTEGELPRGLLIRTRVVGAVYGTQQSVIDEVVDDRLAMAVVLLHQQDRALARHAIDAVGEAERAVTALGDLATDLARAAGRDSDGPRSAARGLGFAALDGPYRLWLRELAAAADPDDHRIRWQQEAYRHVCRVGEQLISQAGHAAWEGRVVATGKGSQWLNSASADKWFRIRLGTALSDPYRRDRPPHDGSVAGPGPLTKEPA